MLSGSIRSLTSGSERRSLTIAPLPSLSEILTVTRTSDVRLNPGNLRLLQVNYFKSFLILFLFHRLLIVFFLGGSGRFLNPKFLKKMVDR